MKNLLELLTWLFLLVGIIMVLIPLVFWFKNPDFTSMQIFIKFWWAHVSVIISVFMIYYIEDNKTIIF